jgi:hypothetical protein
MRFLRRPPKPPSAQDSLQLRLAELERDLEFYREQNERLAREAAPALRENSVLRYQLSKCHSDRQILEFHLQGARAEANAALQLLQQLNPGGRPSSDQLLEAILLLCFEARSLGLSFLEDLEDEAQAMWRSARGTSWTFDPARWLTLRLGGLVAALGAFEQRLLNEQGPEGLRSLPPLAAKLHQRFEELTRAPSAPR